ncbi:E3 ubiquitin-protein ligase Midline-1-like [Haliotis rubra]|uniref:E3 ubiquitin-protein ligase Midline-1-like n=1 Tax=Haliotis rubra TaxID=36100 RepID=UPI001EE62A9E|nr:E3 ubiquitin-protein ligase Midline-1-like [Haliotis rubra]
MATSQKLTEHFLTCSICTEVFDKPCTLVCNHTFCRKCVVNYTKTRREAISAKSLLCPFCRKMTKVSDPEKPVEEWADDVQPIFVIQGLLDSFGPGSKDTTNCSYCKEEGETTPATSWCSVCDDALCERCTRMHQRIPSSRNHDIVDLSSETKVKVKRKVMCKVHKDENIKYLCKDCKTAVCQTCCIIHHRKCDMVVEIESEIPAMKTELKKNKENLLKKHDEMKTYVGKQNSIVKEELALYIRIESSIKSASLRAIQMMKAKERKLLSELKEMSDRHIGQLKADIKSGEMSVQMYQQQTELIDQALQSECDMNVYEIYQGCEAGDVQAVGVVDVKEKGRIDRITFRQDSDKLSRALEDLHLGEIHVQCDDVLDLKAAPVLQDTINVLDLKAAPVLQDTIDVLDLKSAPVLQDTIIVTVAGDAGGGYPIDVTVLEVNGTDTVVVTDFENNSVKSFYSSNSQPGHSKLNLVGKPYGIARLKHNLVVVTLRDTSQIVTVEVTPDLVLLSTITTSKQYWGITSPTPSTLAASSESPPCVDILDMSGHVLKSVCPRPNG